MSDLSRLSDVVPHPTSSDANRAPFWMAAAVALVLAIMASLWGEALTQWPNNGSGQAAQQLAATNPTVYETAVGSQSTVQLSDATQIILNNNSRIRVSYEAHHRLVFLERGEIHIDVAHDRSRPLSVIAGGRVVQAVGTAFSVSIDRPEQVDVLVTNGKVRVGIRSPSYEKSGSDVAGQAEIAEWSSIAVAAGEEVTLGSGDETVKTLSPEDIEVRLSWRAGNLIFRGEALTTVAAEISRYTSVEFAFMTDDIQDIRIAGLFKSGDVEGFLAALRTNFNITYEVTDDDRILLKPM